MSSKIIESLFNSSIADLHYLKKRLKKSSSAYLLNSLINVKKASQQSLLKEKLNALIVKKHKLKLLKSSSVITQLLLCEAKPEIFERSFVDNDATLNINKLHPNIKRVLLDEFNNNNNLSFNYFLEADNG